MPPRPAARVLLLGWDAADWNFLRPLMERGALPHFTRLVEGGVSGSLRTLLPILSPILWTSIATGQTGDRHGVLSFVEPDPAGGSIRPVASTSRTAKAFWNILSQHGLRSVVLGWFASHPAERIDGVIVSDRFATTPVEQPLEPGTVHPAALAEELAELRIAPQDLTALQVRPFFGEALPADEDPRLLALCEELAKCATMQQLAVHFAARRDWDVLAVYYDALDHFGHGFAEYHPPRMAHVSEADFALYRHVMESAYQFHDLMLGRLLELVGPETTVVIVSDHGFHHGELRPPRQHAAAADPLAWHRPQGIFVAHGPGVRQDELVHGASLLEVAPTLLHLLGVPSARDFAGQPLRAVFVDPPALEPVASHEPPHPRDGVWREAAPAESNPWAAREALAQLAALGYVAPDETDDAQKVALAVESRTSNLAQIHFSAGRPAEALALLESMLPTADRPHLRCRIALCHLALGRAMAGRALIEGVLTTHPRMPLARLIYGQIQLAAGELGEAFATFESVAAEPLHSAQVQTYLGQIYLRRQLWAEAEAAFRRALERDADLAEAHDLLGVALRQQGRWDEALESHMRAAALDHARFSAHVHLGMAAAKLGQVDWAIRAFETASALEPAHPFPHRCLARLHKIARRDLTAARRHAERALELRRDWFAARRGGPDRA
ncbi:MAG: alkaline phosphatase family protein [Verrucomicrobia bacterium]|nr:alkaline phosphatase family protein [Verrucomicrobiota bacterium]